MIIESMLGLALSMPADPSLKCPATHRLPGFPRETPVVIVDGQIRAGDPSLADLEASDIHRIEIMCWNPETDELGARSGIQLILVTTTATMTAAESATLEATRVVREFIAEKNDWVPRYLHNVDPSLVGYSIEFGELGWTMASPDINGIECVATQQGGAAVDVECSNTHSVAKKSLRDAWELGAQAF